MFHRDPRRWLIFDEGTTVRLWLRRTPSLAEWEGILEALHAYLPHARKVVLEGPGWGSTSGRAIVQVLEEELPEADVQLVVRALVS